MLHVSQPGVSRLIRHLELQLDVALFVRRSGRLVPTAEARELHDEIEKVYRGVLHVRDVAAHLRYGTNSTLRLLSSANAALQLVPRSIDALGGQFSGARVMFESVPIREIIRLLVAEEADVGISSAAVDHPALIVEELGRWGLVCAIPESHPVLQKSRLRLRDLLSSRLVVYSPEAPQSALIDRWIEAHEVSRNVAAEVRSGFAACSVAATGLAIAFVDELSARAHRPEGLVFAALPGSQTFPIFTVRNRHRTLSRLGTEFLRIAKTQFSSLCHDGPALCTRTVV